MNTEKQLKFIENYCETGDAVQSAVNAGYKNSHTIVNQAWKLKRELSREISKRMLEKFVDKAPVAFGTLIELMNESDSDTVRLQASKDIMDRGGFKPKDTMVIEEEAKTIPELESELQMLVGKDKADLLLGKVKPETEEFAKIAVSKTKEEDSSQHIN
jgi:phage terminase small subunit|tara:strand:+ start:42 stop:515 length:474 start_codon:yes stop_codon:yes gene_type:complete